jgi:hypothetical protein
MSTHDAHRAVTGCAQKRGNKRGASRVAPRAQETRRLKRGGHWRTLSSRACALTKVVAELVGPGSRWLVVSGPGPTQVGVVGLLTRAHVRHASPEAPGGVRLTNLLGQKVQPVSERAARTCWLRKEPPPPRPPPPAPQVTSPPVAAACGGCDRIRHGQWLWSRGVWVVAWVVVWVSGSVGA